MKINLKLSFVLILLLFTSFASADSENSQSRIDVTYIKLSNQEWKSQVLQYQHDPVRLMQLMLRETICKSQNGFAIEALRNILETEQFTTRDKKCMDLIAAYIVLYDIEKGLYDWGPNRRNMPITTDQAAVYEEAETAGQKDGENSWLACLALGREWNLMPPQWHGSEGMRLIRRAVQLAPNVSYTHYVLGEQLRNGYHPDREVADKELSRALELDPPCAPAAMIRLSLAKETHNSERQSKAKRQLLPMIPYSYDLGPEWRKYLAAIP